MLGRSLYDPDRIESRRARAVGLGLLPIATTFLPVKTTHQVKGQVAAGHGLLRRAHGLSLTGYEIHMGRSRGAAGTAPFHIAERSRTACEAFDGCTSPDGTILGTYLHGLFHNEPVRRAILSELAARTGRTLTFSNGVPSKEEQYDRLAALVRNHLDMNLISRLLGKGK